MATGIISGAKWTAVERFSNQFIQFGVSIVISRLIDPEEFGILAVLLVFINISQVFIDSGLGSSLIYYNQINKNDFNTTFSFNTAVSFILLLLIFAFSSVIENFYDISNLSTYLRVSSCVLITNSLIVVPTAILKIKLDFKKLSLSNLISNTISAFIGVSMAVIGYGVWALVGQMLSKSILLSVLLFIQCKWIPKLTFYKKSFQKLYKYGVNIFATSIITKFTEEGISTVIAKFLTPFNLGIFTRSMQFASFPTSCIGSLMITVTFPALSAAKSDKERYNKLYIGALHLQSFLVIPLYLWLAVAAKPIVLLLLTDKWIAAVPVFQILCIGRVLALLAITTEQNLNAIGRSDLCLKQQIFKMILKILLFVIALPFGIIAVAIADALHTLAQFYISNQVASKVIGYTVAEQFRLCLPYLLSSIIASVITYTCMTVVSNYFLQIIISFLIGTSIYLFIILYVFKLKEPLDLWKLIKK